MHRKEITTDGAPSPAGTYSQAIAANGLLWIAGKTPRTPEGTRVTGSFEEPARQTLDNVEAVARAAGSSLSAAVKVNVYLRDPENRGTFDEIYREYVGKPAPARCLVQSDLPGFDIEVDAVLLLEPEKN
jgi:2-iminobutanoate/2-iminopropanoate deaminase